MARSSNSRNRSAGGRPPHSANFSARLRWGSDRTAVAGPADASSVDRRGCQLAALPSRTGGDRLRRSPIASSHQANGVPGVYVPKTDGLAGPHAAASHGVVWADATVRPRKGPRSDRRADRRLPTGTPKGRRCGISSRIGHRILRRGFVAVTPNQVLLLELGEAAFAGARPHLQPVVL